MDGDIGSLMREMKSELYIGRTTMTDNQIKRLVERYRKAIETAHRKGLFIHDIALDDFPRGSCGDVSYLLAEYLYRNGIETIWYSAQRGEWSHAWLVIKDGRVHEPTPNLFSWPAELATENPVPADWQAPDE